MGMDGREVPSGYSASLVLLDRRGFLKLSSCAMAAFAVPGCASVAMTRVTPRDGALRISLADHLRLAAPGGYLRLQPENGSPPVYLLAHPDGGYVALSPICTHLGCTVNIEGPRLVCPCHGSTYDRAGDVLRGPAERPLARYPVDATDTGDLIIRLDSRS